MSALTLGDRVVDLEWRTVRGPDLDERLTEREADVLRVLAAADGRPVDVDELIARAWPQGATEQALQSLVTRLRRKLEPDPDQPRFLRTLRHEGYALRVDVGRAAVPSAGPALLGRETELGALQTLAVPAAIVTLTGAAGAGKTTLALAWQRHVAARPAAVAWCSLETARDLGDVLRAVALATSAPIEGRDTERDLLALGRWLPRYALVVLDNCEQVRDAVAFAVERWRGAATLLVTSRVPLGVPGERRVDVGPLPAVAARDLFLRGARAAVDGFVADGDVIDRIVARLDRLPLAITLAAARVTVYEPTELLDRLSSALDVLTSTRRDLPERQRAVRVALDGSWDLLSTDEQAALAALSVFPGGFSVDGAEAVIDGDALGALHALHDQSLVQVSPEPRLSMYETVREYAAERLIGPARARAEQRHAAGCVAAVQTWVDAVAGPREGEAIVHLSAFLPDLLAVVDRDVAPATAVDAALAAHVALLARGPFDRHLAMLDRAVALAGKCDAERLMRALVARARVRDMRTDNAGAGADFRQVLDEGTFPAHVSDAHSGLAGTAHRAGRASEARAHALSALQAAERAGDPARVGRARALYGLLLSHGADVAAGLDHLHASVRIAAELGDARAEGVAEHNLGIGLRVNRHPDAAEAAFSRSLALAERVGDLRVQGMALSNLGRLLLDRGRWTEGVALLDRAAALVATQGDRRSEAVHTIHAARGRVQLGDVDAAIATVEGILAELPGEAWLGASAGYVRATAFARGGRWAETRDALDALQLIAERDHEIVGMAAALRAVALARLGDVDGARAALRGADMLRDEPMLAPVVELATAIVESRPSTHSVDDNDMLDVRLFATL